MSIFKKTKGGSIMSMPKRKIKVSSLPTDKQFLESIKEGNLIIEFNEERELETAGWISYLEDERRKVLFHVNSKVMVFELVNAAKRKGTDIITSEVERISLSVKLNEVIEISSWSRGELCLTIPGGKQLRIYSSEHLIRNHLVGMPDGPKEYAKMAQEFRALT